MMKHKKLMAAVFAAIVAVVCCFAFAACGDSVEKVEGSAGLEYQLSEDGTYYTVTGVGTCTDVDVVIGNWHEDLPVRGIGERVMRNFTYDVNSITVSQGIDIFGAAAVSNFTMTKLVLPDGIETYGSAAFLRCEKLEEIVFGKGLKKIEYDSFMGCGENVTIYFRGTEAEWDAVQIDAQGNELMDGYTVVCNYTGA